MKKEDIIKSKSFLITIFSLPICLIIGFLTNIILLLVIYFMIPLTFFGVIGGRWLWEQLASSDIFRSGIPIYVKSVGFVAIAIFLIFILEGFYIYLIEENAIIIQIVQSGTQLMYFVAVYNIGYLISIWNPTVEEKKDGEIEFKLKKKLNLQVLSCISIWILLSFIISIIITQNFTSILFLYLATGGAGMAIGWIVWEHLKETDMLSGEFLKTLKILSIGFEIPVILLFILGFIADFLQIDEFYRLILLGYILIFYLMVVYFLGLLIEVIKK
ncbi:MAG: hypothetical protein GY870_03225 [archaeon]|nr:hypothetical protein [archaeon]